MELHNEAVSINVHNDSSSTNTQTLLPSSAADFNEALEKGDLRLVTAYLSMVYVELLIVVGIFGNILVCYVFGCRLKWAGAHNFLTFTLAFFDLLNCLSALPAEIADVALHYKFNSAALCKILRFLNAFAVISSTSTLVVIALERYRHVKQPIKIQMLTYYARLSIIPVPVLAFLLSSPTIYLYGPRSMESSMSRSSRYDCAISDDVKDTIYPLVYNAILFVYFVAMATTLVGMYTLTMGDLKQQSRRCWRPSVATTSLGSGWTAEKHLTNNDTAYTTTTPERTHQYRLKQVSSIPSTYATDNTRKALRRWELSTSSAINPVSCHNFNHAQDKFYREDVSRILSSKSSVLMRGLCDHETPHICVSVNLNHSKESHGRRKLDIQKLDIQKLDIQKLDIQKLDIQKLDIQKLDIQKLDIQKLDIQKLDIQKLDIQKLDIQKLDIQKPGFHEPNLHAFPPLNLYFKKLEVHNHNQEKLDVHNLDQDRLDGQMLHHLRLNLQKLDVQKQSQPKLDHQKINHTPLIPHVLNVQKLDSQKQDVQKLDSQKQDVQKLDSQKQDVQKLDHQELHIQKLDTNKHKNHNNITPSYRKVELTTTTTAFVVTAGFVVNIVFNLWLEATRLTGENPRGNVEAAYLDLCNTFLRSYFINAVTTPIIYWTLNVKFRAEVKLVMTRLRWWIRM